MTLNDAYFDFYLSTEQRNAVESILDFIQSGNEQVCILSGYAGTGKTSLLKGIKKHLDETTPMQFWATTGRAAKIISSKTNMPAETIHRSIYRLKLSKEDKKNRIIKLFYELIVNMDSLKHVYAIDECSQLSDKQTLQVNLSFGTGRLLTDSLSYLEGRKVILIGDNAQLPPINYLYSPALNPEYFQKEFNLNARHIKLTNIKRFDKSSGIYKNTKKLRQYIDSEVPYPRLQLEATFHSDISIYPDESRMIKEYVKLARQAGIDNIKFITLSNKKASWLNLQIRQQLFKGKKPKPLRETDMLMVNQNNYLYELMNGDNIQVSWVNPHPIYRAGFRFREVEVKCFDPKIKNYKIRKVILFEELLHREKNNLTLEEEYKLRRYLFGKAKELNIDKNSNAFDDFTRNEPFFNALRVGYGYANTCHKAQGGEWEHVFIALEKTMLYLPPETQYRWAYTAMTRARKHIHLLDNMYIT